jgi:RNA polymerase sigma-70 factor, ECF subfamily
MDQKTEAEIVARVLKGDRQAYALLVEEYKTPVYNLAYRMTRSLADAEDIAQEAFLRAFQELSRYDRDRRFYTWLYTICLNIIRNHLKKTSRRQGMISSGVIAPDREGAVLNDIVGADESRKELEEQLDKYLDKLSPGIRELLILRFYQGLSFEEIADISGLSLSAVKMRVYRGLEKLQKYFEKM